MAIWFPSILSVAFLLLGAIMASFGRKKLLFLIPLPLFAYGYFGIASHEHLFSPLWFLFGVMGMVFGIMIGGAIALWLAYFRQLFWVVKNQRFDFEFFLSDQRMERAALILVLAVVTFFQFLPLSPSAAISLHSNTPVIIMILGTWALLESYVLRSMISPDALADLDMIAFWVVSEELGTLEDAALVCSKCIAKFQYRTNCYIEETMQSLDEVCDSCQQTLVSAQNQPVLA